MESRLKPQVIFVVDAGPSMGLGHLRRCLTLADCLKERGVSGAIVAPPDDTVAELIRSCNHPHIPGTAKEVAQGSFDNLLAGYSSLLFLDSYGLTANETVELHRLTHLVASIDDFNSPYPEVDVLINAIPGGGVPSARQTCLFGPQYAILRPAFSGIKHRVVRQRVTSILVTLGGSDPLHLTERVLPVLDDLVPPRVLIQVVLGPLASDVGDIALTHPERVTWHRSPRDIARLMDESELCITAGGQTLFETAASGLPSVVVQVADNQTANILGFVGAGTACYAGWGQASDLETRLSRTVESLLDSPTKRLGMSRAGQRLVDGRGGARVASCLAGLLNGN